MQVKEIPRKDLVIDKMNVRKEWISDNELSESIERQGIIEPLVVRKKDTKFGIVCGFRRFHAGLEVGLKTFPCVEREMEDLDAKGLSLQENLQRNNLDRVEEAEAIADIWGMMNGTRSYEEKIREMEKRFGLKERVVNRYLAISKLSDKIKVMLKTALKGSKLGIDEAAELSSADWSDKEKEQVAKILSRIESSDKRRKVLSQMKSYKDLSPTKAYEKVKRVPEGRNYNILLEPKVVHAFDKACQELNKDYKTLIREIIASWLEKKGYLK